MSSSLRHQFPSIEGIAQSLTSGFLGSNPSVVPPGITSSGTTVIGSGNSQQIIGSVYETYKIDRATFVQADDSRLRSRFAEWLSFKAHNAPHEAAIRAREPGTGEWFLKGFIFEQWLETNASLLWLHGGVGCGKTVLFASIIEKIRDLKRAKTGQLSLCYFYCSFQDGSRHDLSALLKLIAAQLCSTTVPHQLQALYEDCHNEYPPRSPLNEELIECIFSILGQNEPHGQPSDSLTTAETTLNAGEMANTNLEKSADKEVYLVIDALDEVPIEEREDILNFLHQVAELKLHHTHVLVTSRTEPVIAEAFALSWTPVIMNTATIKQDIELYVSRAIEKHAKLRRLSDFPKEMIQKRLVEGGKGMFRWAALQMAGLRQTKVATRETIEAALLRLPKDLDETYARIIGDIDDTLQQQAFAGLQWLALSTRPLFIEELIEACAIDIQKIPIIDRHRCLRPFQVFEMLHDLITIEPMLKDDSDVDDRSHTVLIAHFSVLEYLTSLNVAGSQSNPFKLKYETSQLFIAERCLAYLYHFNTFQLRHEKFPLREYAWYNWEHHITPSYGEDVAPSIVRRKAMLLYKHLATVDASLIALLIDDASIITHFGQSTAHFNIKFAMHLAIRWLPIDGTERLRDSLDTPYFLEDFDAFHGDCSPGLADHCGAEPLPGLRLLSILPALDDDTLMRCRLVPTILADLPKYDALSHTLGRDCTVLFELEGKGYLADETLARLLHNMRARRDVKDARFWMESFCTIGLGEMLHDAEIIKQAGRVVVDAEKASANIIHEAEIIKKARGVIVGLGEEIAGDESAIRALLSLLAPFTCEKILEIDKQKVWSSVMSLFRQPGWCRTGIINETVLAANITWLLGSLSLNFQVLEQLAMLERAFDTIMVGRYRHDFSTFYNPYWDAVRSIALTRVERRAGITISLARALYRFGTHICKDPRDKIFSLYEIIPEQERFAPLDYSQSVHTLLQQMVRYFLQLHRRLDVLSFASICLPMDPIDEGPEPSPSVPSWVPSLKANPHVRLLDPGFFGDVHQTHIFTAGGYDSEPIYGFLDDALVLEGTVIDQISGISSIISPVDSTLNVAEIQSHVTMKGGHSAIEASWRTLMADQIVPGERLTRERLKEWLEPWQTERIQLDALPFIRGRVFMLMERGYIGLGPESAMAGDIVAVMPGGAVPFVLRLLDDYIYKFIGECYIHGIMDGIIPEFVKSEDLKFSTFFII